ncbi:hypothetical protein PN437_15290, partial [Microcystis aeruginosa CS-564/01]|uniref:hypothetical protein n=1 Tax=Microcystis aeruginosa TaxID=1126 RepID=UPI00232B233A
LSIGYISGKARGKRQEAKGGINNQFFITRFRIIPFFFIRVTTNEGLASIRAWMSVMDLEIWYN